MAKQRLNGTARWLVGTLAVAVAVAGAVMAHETATSQIKANTVRIEKLEDVADRVRRIELLVTEIAVRNKIDVGSLLKG